MNNLDNRYELSKFYDFSNCPPVAKSYGGAELKECILFQNKAYMIKFPKEVDGNKTISHVTEYLGSHIFQLFGINAHDTLLGTYQGQEVVAAKDFVYGTEYQLIDFDATGESSYDTAKKDFSGYTYNNILHLLEKHTKYCQHDLLVQHFWKMFVIDALLGNFDRHGMNWGFLKSRDNYQIAPVYDCGSCLFPRIKEEDLIFVTSNEKELDMRTYKFPTSQIKLGDEKSSYYEVIAGKHFEECTKQAKWLIDTIDFNKIDSLIDGVSIISENRKLFLKKILRHRFQKMFVDVFSTI